MCSHSNISKLENFQTDFVLQYNLKVYLQIKNIILNVHTYIFRDSDKNMAASIAVWLLIKLAFVSFDHINKICQGFLFWTWNHLEVFLNTLKWKQIYITNNNVSESSSDIIKQGWLEGCQDYLHPFIYINVFF